MRIYHRTPNAQAILDGGFRDATGTYMTGKAHTGVWFSDTPLDINEGAAGECVFVLEVPAKVFKKWEWVQDIGYREALMPAAVVNRYGPPRIHEHDYSGLTRSELLEFAARTQQYGNEAGADTEAMAPALLLPAFSVDRILMRLWGLDKTPAAMQEAGQEIGQPPLRLHHGADERNAFEVWREARREAR